MLIERGNVDTDINGYGHPYKDKSGTRAWVSPLAKRPSQNEAQFEAIKEIIDAYRPIQGIEGVLKVFMNAPSESWNPKTGSWSWNVSWVYEVTNDLYGGTYRLFTKIFENYGIKFHFIGMNNTNNIDKFITNKTKMVWAETPTNPMLNIINIEKVAKIAKNNNLIFVVDNTFATPYLQRPLELGADIVMHSLTKYMGGHSDVVMGALICKNDLLAERLFFIQNSCGAIPGPMDSFLVLRGIKTLHLRMQKHCENANLISTFLSNHPKVQNVYWPGLKSHENHEIAKKQMDDFGGMVSFNIVGNKLADAVTVVSNTHYFTLAESLGGVESLCGHPASMTHAAIPKEEREKTGVVDSLIRLSVGIEDIEDLISDLDQALSKI